MSSLFGVAASKLREWREKPPLFVRQVFKVEPDGWQDSVLEAFVPENQRLCMKACKNPGKTAVLAWCDWLFLLTRPHPKVIATSITGPNLSDGLWTEMAKWQNVSPMLKDAFTWANTKIVSNDHPETWYMAARQWPRSATKEQQADTLAGKHGDYVLFNLDEVGGIPRSVVVAATAALGSGIESKVIMAGNPTQLDSPLYDACTVERPLWKLFEITGDPDDPKRAPRVSLQWAKDEIQRWGRNNPWVKANVLGEFPPASINSLLGPDDVSRAMGRHLRIDEYSFAQVRIGVDVARFGDDRTVITVRQGLAMHDIGDRSVMRNARTQDIAARVALVKAEKRAELIFVDGSGGWGAGVVDALQQAGHIVYEVNSSGEPTDPRFFNKRSEMEWLAAEWVKRGAGAPNDPELAREMAAPTYTFYNNKIRVEEKDQIKARLGVSPDKWDSLKLTFAMPDMPRDMAELGGDVGTGDVISDYEQFPGRR